MATNDHTLNYHFKGPKTSSDYKPDQILFLLSQRKMEKRGLAMKDYVPSSFVLLPQVTSPTKQQHFFLSNITSLDSIDFVEKKF